MRRLQTHARSGRIDAAFFYQTGQAADQRILNCGRIKFEVSAHITGTGVAAWGICRKRRSDMMRWKKEVLCVLCICAFFALGGCGNGNDQKTNPQSETITDKNGEVQSEMGNNTGDNTLIPEDGAGGDVTDGMENGENTADPGNTAAPNSGNANGTVNDATDDGNVNDVTDNGTGVGGAAKDIVDGVGDAGKDLIDGVEDAGDALTGEDPADTAR